MQTLLLKKKKTIQEQYAIEMSSIKSEPSGLFIQMVNLKYKQFIHMIEELNGIFL